MSSTINTDQMVHQIDPANAPVEEVHFNVPNVEQEPTAEDNYTIEDQRKEIAEGNDIQAKQLAPVVYSAIAAFQNHMLTSSNKVKSKTWNGLPKAEKESIIYQVSYLAANYPMLTVHEYHKARFEAMAEDGWTYGEEYSAKDKTSPEYVQDYENAPDHYRVWLNLMLNNTYSILYGIYGDNYPYSFVLFNLQAQKANEVNSQIHDKLVQQENVSANNSEGTDAEPSYVNQ